MEAVRYRRTRDLNNAASKRCRLNRKRKYEDMESEVDFEAARNMALKAKESALEEQVEKYKKFIIQIHQQKNRRKPEETVTAAKFDIDTLVKDTLETHFS